MEKKLNNGDDGTKRKSIDDHERRRQAEKSHAAEQQRRAKAIDGPQLVRDVMVKLGFQRQPAEREHINMKIFEANMSLEKLMSAGHAKEDQRNFEPPMPEQLFEREETEGFQAYGHGYTAGLKAQEVTITELRNPDVLKSYTKGLEEHRTDLYIGKNVENAKVPQISVECVNQLLTTAYNGRLHNLEKQNLEVKSDGPEFDH
ncbi:hypothetical protein OYC61_011565 [Alcaligenes nematophilus]|uniref:Uncharacterized protein n=1 Tax=Alcaligenes nematophilus TaxID=2994643 RepID=A0ABU3MT27_9BURK|nr:hypothetical protein [Alcaligenes nematophilus]MDT8466446.1 hypothetical protein [Alcaligenes nematophilus]MDT8470529.1 hypothetical protein [Alcaligenes nematophilus]MDT8504933.1 hypothetical protein [Alcaligenes nematophilus]MDT8526917.1 hypothetical protein [Alcaligenes nematophilus]